MLAECEASHMIYFRVRAHVNSSAVEAPCAHVTHLCGALMFVPDLLIIGS